MNITITLLIALPIAFSIYTVRRGIPQVRTAWRHARWYEKAAMLLIFVPIPGPVDEFIAFAVIARIIRRVNQGGVA